MSSCIPVHPSLLFSLIGWFGYCGPSTFSTEVYYAPILLFGMRVRAGIWCTALPSLSNPAPEKPSGTSGVAGIATKVSQPRYRNAVGLFPISGEFTAEKLTFHMPTTFYTALSFLPDALHNSSHLSGGALVAFLPFPDVCAPVRTHSRKGNTMS